MDLFSYIYNPGFCKDVCDVPRLDIFFQEENDAEVDKEENVDGQEKDGDILIQDESDEEEANLDSDFENELLNDLLMLQIEDVPKIKKEKD